jgi:hypothetical protein
MSDNSIQDHYAGDDTGSAMASRILAAVRAVYGRDAAITPETLVELGRSIRTVGDMVSYGPNVTKL